MMKPLLSLLPHVKKSAFVSIRAIRVEPLFSPVPSFQGPKGIAEICWDCRTQLTMRRNRADSRTITGIAEATAERVRLTGELLQALAHAIARDEKVQRKFRDAVLIRLSRIETIANLIHAAEIGALYRNHPCFEEKLMEDAKHAEQFISEKSQEMGLAMINYIYGGAQQQPASKPKTRRKWSDCPSYEI